MNIAGIEADDVVEIDRRGHVFEARVLAKAPGRLQLDPLRRNISWRQATSHQVIRHWRRRALVRGRVSTATIRAGDIVTVAIDGEEAFARVLSKERTRLRVLPLRRHARPVAVSASATTCHFQLRGRPRNGRR